LLERGGDAVKRNGDAGAEPEYDGTQPKDDTNLWNRVEKWSPGTYERMKLLAAHLRAQTNAPPDNALPEWFDQSAFDHRRYREVVEQLRRYEKLHGIEPSDV
jgi:hypothetical protein